MPIRAIAPIAAAVALCLSSLSAMAAEIKPAELLEQANAEKSAYIETVKQLVAVDTGTGQAEGLATVSQMLVERLQALGAEVSTSPATLFAWTSSAPTAPVWPMPRVAWR